MKAWGADDVDISPVERAGWVGNVKKGSPVNFFNIKFNPMGMAATRKPWAIFHR
ncbi:MAG: hypothetical protein U5L96_19490 [Owenweeksia sp.]|nr:hypothetical protein [Owenweeksia sp.]